MARREDRPAGFGGGGVSGESELWPESYPGAPPITVPGTGRSVPVVTPPPPKKEETPPVVPPKTEEPVNTQRPPEVAGDRKPAATRSVTGQSPIPVPRTNHGAGMNMATWVKIYEDWGRDMMRAGFLPDQLPAIVAAAGEEFPKSLVATFNAQDALGPRADMLQQYDLNEGMQRSVPHRNADYPEGTGYGEWQAIPDNVRQAQNDFFNWAYDPANEAWINKFGGHAFAAWMASPTGRGAPGALQGFGNVNPVAAKTPVPVTDPAVTYPDQPTASASIGHPLATSVQSLTNSLSNPIGFGSSALGTAPGGPSIIRTSSVPSPVKTAPPVAGQSGAAAQRDPSQPAKRGAWYSGFGM
jgi:hypothetical protein